MADLIDIITRDGQAFSFFQAVALLEEYFGKKGHKQPLRSGDVRFLADPSIVFPHTDVSAIDEENDCVKITCTFMGLVGSSSPLPNYFSDYIARNPENAQGLYDFCTMFNNRVYALFYRAYCKYRFNLAVCNGDFLNNISLLAGNTDAAGDEKARRMLAYTGVLSSRRRSARALETVIADYFEGVDTVVVENYPRWAPVANPTRLGAPDAELGVSTMVGTEVFDMSGKFRVRVGPLKREVFETFLEGSEKIGDMRKLTKTFCADPLDFDIEIRLSALELVAVVLGQDNARLGQTTSLGESTDTLGDAYSVVLPGYN